MLDILEIQKLLPHRYPLLLVDRVTEMELGKSIVAYKNISISEPAFMGHFPGHPIYPGVMILEGLAQAGGILASKSSKLSKEELASKVIYFMSIDKAKFRAPVKPGDQLVYKVEVDRIKGAVIALITKAYVDDKLCAQAEMKAMMVDI